jgi:hypothetical protein
MELVTSDKGNAPEIPVVHIPNLETIWKRNSMVFISLLIRFYYKNPTLLF